MHSIWNNISRINIIGIFILFSRLYSINRNNYANIKIFKINIFAILLKNKEIVVELRYIVLYVFYLYYIKVFTEIIFEKNIKWRNVIKKCNNILVFSMLLLTTFQQWYLIWLFTIIMWQNNKKINRLLSITIITELANAIYMYKSEWYNL